MSGRWTVERTNSATRQEVWQKIGSFIEVYGNASLATYEQRDIKGLYQRARCREIKQFTRIDDSCEPPLNPEVICYVSIASYLCG